ncbi:hypothetical protein GGI13_001308 [Coemansia sp. RSA 455]|nr:hypothetical protein LPJ71_001061 [Coemansia sp. S17]KAJ2017482.1 hypothetical protein GGI14_002968 [Coemansia sp. S680]KAJ2035540.1 hypothetical protein H4S03_004245 [Coemansia sp. S3946]KAJ2048512.1 hypothetical protein H4S04_003787 [Coemansia sp. S16]KAJ2066045.1 hypothetical protein GGI08_002057 [Coemansia sp. S2]KAJ2070847.1 hypothetical protein GGH13_003744 [Coemansia sp. S155-1]KAJ2097787.1 hypothetical protein GGI09_003650 [Coemansia sp. S100]KAJ2102751.1 hypothetical protein GGI1
MTENRHSAKPGSFRPARRFKLLDGYLGQETTAGGVSKKRKAVLVEQSPHMLNQAAAAQASGAKRDPKKMSKVEIPVSPDTDPFSTNESITSPLTTMDEMLLAKDIRVGDVTSPESRKSAATPSPQLSEAEIAALRLQASKMEIENVTLKHALLEAKTELEDAEKRLREKDDLIKDQDQRIEDLIDTRVPWKNLEDFIAGNKVLEERLKENEKLLADCQKSLEDYVAAGKARGF